MTSEQLLATRATLWRHKAEPLLTLDDAQSWLLQTGLCLFLPRKAQIPAPAPSFVEACLGETNPTPPRQTIEAAKELLVRLIESDSAVPLNLLGTSSDHPDFLVSKEALPFVYALRGDRDWKHAPGAGGANRVSPLVTEVWGLLEERPGLAATEIREALGRELTEAAVLRALHELWASLRVEPLYRSGGRETLWEPLQARHRKAITSGAGMSQVTALSVLVSIYLQSVVAASGEEVEAFLSPLASRSKVREAVRGLTATRQLGLVQMETHSLLHVEGSLPEFPEEEKPKPEAGTAGPVARRLHPTSPEAIAASLRGGGSGASTRPVYKRPAAFTGKRDASRAAGRPSGSFRPSGGGRPAAGGRPDSSRVGVGGYRPASGGARPAFGKPGAPKEKFGEKFVRRQEPGTGLRADGTPKKTRWRDMPGGRPDQKGKPARFGPRKAEGSNEGQPARPTSGAFRPVAGGKAPYKRTFSSGGGKSFRDDGAKRPGSGAGGAGRRPGSTFSKPGDKRSGGRPSGGFAARGGAARPFSRPRGENDTSSDVSRGTPGGQRRFTPKSASGAPAKFGGPASSRPRSGQGRPFSRPGNSPTGGRPSSGRASFGKGPGGRPSGNRPSGFKPSGSRPSGPRPGFGQGPRPGGRPRTGGFGAKPGGKPPGGRPPAKFKKRPGSPE